MSREKFYKHSFKKVLTVSLLSLGMVGVAVYFFQRATLEQTRKVASVPKKFKANPWLKAHSHPHKIAGKARAHLWVEVGALNSGPIVPGESFVLKGRITAQTDISEITVRWIIPDNIRAVRGETEFPLFNLKAGEAREVEITIVSDTPELRRIFLHAYENVSGKKMGNIAQFVTTMPASQPDGAYMQKATGVHSTDGGRPTKRILQ